MAHPSRNSRFSREVRSHQRPFVVVHLSRQRPVSPRRSIGKPLVGLLRKEALAWSQAVVTTIDLVLFTVVDGLVDSVVYLAKKVDAFFCDKVVQSLVLLSMRIVVGGLVLLPALSVLRELAMLVGDLNPELVRARESLAQHYINARFLQ